MPNKTITISTVWKEGRPDCKHEKWKEEENSKMTVQTCKECGREIHAHTETVWREGNSNCKHAMVGEVGVRQSISKCRHCGYETHWNY